MDRWRAAGALLALAACFAGSAAAPTAGNHSALDLYDGAVVEGCYYNFQHYGEGDRIMTNEPCLNCTCHNRMLMCYLRVCPFTKPIGQNCTVEKRADQCCPIVTCPDVPVDLLTSTSTSSPAEYGATGIGKYDKYGCSIDGKYLPEGAKVPPTPNKPCEHCYCIRNMTTCVMQECTLHVDGCTPIYHKDVCCPVRYSCDHAEDEIPLLDDMTTTVRPTPGFILTTTTMSPVTQMTQDCVHDDKVFADGALIKTEKACEHCYCMKGDIVCVVQECGTPMENEGKNCTSLPPREGQCCPDTYICEGDESNTEYPSEFTTNLYGEGLTTLSPPRRTGVEGSGYRKETEERPIPELTAVSEAEGSGEEKTTEPSEVITDTPIEKTQRPHITEPEMITTEVPLATESVPLQTESVSLKTESAPLETESAPLQTESVPLETESAPLATESVPLATESVPLVTDSAPLGTESAPLATESAPLATQSVPLVTESTSSSGESAPLATELAPLATELAPLASESAPLATDSAPLATESASLPTEKNILETQTEEGSAKADGEKDQPDYEKSTIESITAKPSDIISPDSEKSEHSSTESVKQMTDSDEEQKVTSSTKSDTDLFTTSELLDIKQHGEVSSATTSTLVYEDEKITLEQSMPESTTIDSKTSQESETISSTPADSHTLTLEEVEKEESEEEKHKVDTDKISEEFTTESHELVSVSDNITPQVEEPHKTHSDADEGFNKEITETQEFIPVTTSVSNIALELTTTESNKEDSITEKETDEESAFITSVPGAEIESTTLRKDEVMVTKEAEIDLASESHELLPSTTSVTHIKDIGTSISDIDVFIDKTTEHQKYITSNTDVPILGSETTEKGTAQEITSSDQITTTMTSTFEDKDHTMGINLDSGLDTITTPHKLEDTLGYLTTTVSDLDKDLQTPSQVTAQDITSHDTKYVSSSDLPLSEVEIGDTTTEPDKGLNTIPADGLYEGIVTSAPHDFESESHLTKEEEISMNTESGLIKDITGSETGQTTSSESLVQKELSTTSKAEIYDNTKLPEQKETTYPTSTSITEIERESSTEISFDKTDKPEISVANQGENEIHEEAVIPGRIPGEGDCLLNGITYRNESDVPNTNNCHTGCKCISSIIKCNPIICSPPPDYMDNCQPTYDPPDACCPTYECTHISKETMPPQPQNQMSGTEAPIHRPPFECRGDQCEISEDKIQTSVSHETCAGGKCEVDIDKKIEQSDCGPLGCDHVEETSVPQDSAHSVICTNGECNVTQLQPTQPCEGVNCDHSESLSPEISEKCENEDNCNKESLTPNLPCQGNKCIETEQTNPPITESEDEIICKGDGDCHKDEDHLIKECEGESCRRKEIVETSAKLPETCTDSKCLESTNTIDQHESVGYDSTTPLVPFEEVTKSEEPFSQVLDNKEQYTPRPEDVPTNTEVLETITSSHDTKLDLTTESSTEKEIGPLGTDIDTSTIIQDTIAMHDHTTEHSADSEPDKSTTLSPNEYVTGKIEDISIITEKDEPEKEIDTIPESDDMQNKLTSHDLSEYTTESVTKSVVEQSTQINTESDEILPVSFEHMKPLDIEKDKATESYDTDLDKITQSHGLTSEKPITDTSEHTQEEKVTRDESDMTEYTVSISSDKTTELPAKTEISESVIDSHPPESIIIDTTSPQQITTEESYSTEKQGLDEITKQTEKQEEMGTEQQFTEIITHVDEQLSTTSSAILDTVNQHDQEKSQTSEETDKYEHLDHKTTDTLVTEMPTSPISTDSLVLVVTTPKEIQKEYESTTIKYDIISTVPEKVTVAIEEPQDEQKLEFPTSSEIDAEEYVTEEPGISLEKLATTLQESYSTHLDAITEGPKISEGVPIEPVSVVTGPSLTVTDSESGILKESSTTESPKISETGAIVTEKLEPVDVEQDKLTTEATTSPLTGIEFENNEPTVSAQQELSTENLSSSVTDKYTEATEKEIDKLSKPESEYVTTDSPASTPEAYIDVQIVTEHKVITPDENIDTESAEHFIPVKPDLDQPVTEIKIEDDDLNKITTAEDKTIHLEYESSTKPSESSLHVSTAESVKDQSHVDEYEFNVSEPTVAVTVVPESAEHVSSPVEISTDMPQKEIIPSEAETQTTSVPLVTQRGETQSTLILEGDKETLSTHTITGEVQKATKIPDLSEPEHEIDSKPYTESTTEHLLPDLLETTVTESKEDYGKYTTKVQEPVTEISMITEAEKVIEPKLTTSMEGSAQTTTKLLSETTTTSTEVKITNFTDVTSINTEIPSTTSAYDSSIKENIPPESESPFVVSTEDTDIQQTEISESSSTKLSDISTISPEVYSTEQEETKTVSPISMTTENPATGKNTPEEDVTKHISESIYDNEQEITPIYTKQTTESSNIYSEEMYEFSKDRTTPPQVAPEQTSTSKHEYSESTPDVVELEEHTHQILEESTTPQSSSEEEISYVESTDKSWDKPVTPLSPSDDKAGDIEKSPEKTETKPDIEEEVDHDRTTDKNLEEEKATQLPAERDETKYSETSDKTTDETLLHPSTEEEIKYTEAIDKISGDIATTPQSISENEISQPEITDQLLGDIGTTQRPSLENEISHSEATEKVLKEDTATTSYPSVEIGTGYPESPDETSDDNITTLPPSSQEEIIHGESTDKAIEQIVTTARSTSEESIGEPEATEKNIQEIETPVLPTEESKYTESTQISELTKATLGPSYGEEVSSAEGTDKILEESKTTSSYDEDISYIITTTTPRSVSEKETSDTKATDTVVEETATSKLPSFEETSYTKEGDQTSKESTTTPRLGLKEEAEHAFVTDKITKEPATTDIPRITDDISIAGSTDKIVEESVTTLDPNYEQGVSRDGTTEKTSEEIVTTLHPVTDKIIPSDATATITHIGLEKETTHTDISDKTAEDTVTTPRISSEIEKTEEDFQKPEPIPEVLTDRTTEQQTYQTTKIADDSKSPVKESTETSVTNASLASEITTEPLTHILDRSSTSYTPQQSDIEYTTLSQDADITTKKPTHPIEEDKTQVVSEDKPSEPTKEVLTPGEEILSFTTKTTTVSAEEYATTQGPPPVDESKKPEEKPIESAHSTIPPELPKPSEIQPTDEIPSPEEESHFPPSGTSGYGGETDYGDEDQAFGPGTCRYGGKVYVSAQQIPRDDPCDFCFCFRSDIICLQQSCPPPIHGCHEEPIQGFCCPRYECPVSMATTLNVTTTTTTTTTTLPPHFPTHSYKGAAQRRGCQIKGHTYKVGEVVRASSGPCLHCTCGGDGQMKCDPKACTPEPMLRQMIAAAVSSKRRR